MAKDPYHLWQATPYRGDVVDYLPYGEEKNACLAIVLGNSVSRPGELELEVHPRGGGVYTKPVVRHHDDPCYTQGTGFELKMKPANGTWRFRAVDKPKSYVWDFVMELEARKERQEEERARLAAEREAKRKELIA